MKKQIYNTIQQSERFVNRLCKEDRGIAAKIINELRKEICTYWDAMNKIFGQNRSDKNRPHSNQPILHMKPKPRVGHFVHSVSFGCH
jgi:hypothetical protein